MGIPTAETCAWLPTEEAAPNKDKQITVFDLITEFDPSYTLAPVGSGNCGTYFISLPKDERDPAETIDKKTTSATLTHSFFTLDRSVMHRNGHKLNLNLTNSSVISPQTTSATPKPAIPPLQWDWTIEHEDRKRERKADNALHGSIPFEVDRRVLKDVVREKMGVEVGRITFLSAGTFHKAYLVTLSDHVEIVARVARRFMPRLKTESEVATMQYLREKTNVPVPMVYHYDSNPYNRLGGEFILMSKAPGIPLSRVFHSLPYADLVKLLNNLAAIIIPLFAHRFPDIGSLYSGPDPRADASGAPTPKASQHQYSAYPFSPTLSTPRDAALKPTVQHAVHLPAHEYHVGPIISWPFFGSNRGELVHPRELNRGPWSTVQSYLSSCADREISGVIRENEGRSAPHKLHLDPDEIISSRHHKIRAVPGDESDESDEWDLEESEEEWEGPGDVMYRDYRRMQRSTFLVAHTKQREACVRKEMERWMRMMEHLVKTIQKDESEEFGLDCHDLSLENIFVDAEDNSKITCIIDWESTTIRPLWACTHIPAFLQSSPFLAKLFRESIAQLPNNVCTPQLTVDNKQLDIEKLCREWLYYESAGVRLRMAHRFVEWDGWEEGLVDSILGPEEYEEEWFKSPDEICNSPGSPHAEHSGDVGVAGPGPRSVGSGGSGASVGPVGGKGTNVAKISSKLPFAAEQAKEQMLNTTGDICGGRGGELGRRLEAWLTVTGANANRMGRWSEPEQRMLDAVSE